MASNSPAKSGSSAQYRDVHGYVHDVSKVQIPANPKSSRYLTFTIQENEEETRVICFSAEKRDELKRKEEAKLPTCLTNVSPQKRRFGEGIEYKMNKYSRIEPAKNLAFQWRATKTAQSEFTVTEILESAQSGQSVGLKGKVLSKGDKETVYSNNMKKNLTKCELVVADTTGAITIVLWESQIEEVEKDGCYFFKEVKLNCYSNKYLSCTKTSEIEKCDNIEIPEQISTAAGSLKHSEKEWKKITGSVVGADVRKSFICLSCKSKVADAPETATVKCPSCTLKIKKSESVSTATANIMIKDENGEIMGRFFCPYSAIKTLFEEIAKAPGFNIEKNIEKLSGDTMENTLLNIARLSFNILEEENIVKAIELPNAE